MLENIVKIAGVTAMLLAFGTVAHAEDFPATPIQSGPPRDLPGERLVPGLPEALDLVNGATQPILQPIFAPGEAGAAGGPAPAARHGHHRHHVAAHHARPHHVAARHTHHKLG